MKRALGEGCGYNPASIKIAGKTLTGFAGSKDWARCVGEPSLAAAARFLAVL